MAPLSFVRLVFGWLETRYRVLAGAVLALAAFNLAFRAGSEMVQVWDESLYAITALEMVQSGDWIGTTFLGTLDYYNSKPPLNVWLIALSFKTFGVGLWSLRLPSILCAWTTVAVLQAFTRRCLGASAAIMSSLVLATSYGFLYVHSGRSGNAEALFTLLVLLAIVILWSSQRRPWRRVWLGPVVAAVFMVKGGGILMPLIATTVVEAFAPRRGRERWLPLAAATAICAVLVLPWVIARWFVDQWRFFDAMVFQDLVARATTVLDGHEGSSFYYLYILQKHHYDWLVAGAAAIALMPALRTRLVAVWRAVASERGTAAVMTGWFAATFVLPTVAVTKLGWYLNSFYPLFAVGIGALLAHAYGSMITMPRRAATLLGVVALAFATAESKLWWHSYQKLDIGRSAQSLLLDEGPALAGHRVYAEKWPYADLFIARAVHARYVTTADTATFLRESRIGDYWLGAADLREPRLSAIASTGRQTLYRRRE